MSDTPPRDADYAQAGAGSESVRKVDSFSPSSRKGARWERRFRPPLYRETERDPGGSERFTLPRSRGLFRLSLAKFWFLSFKTTQCQKIVEALPNLPFTTYVLVIYLSHEQ